MGQQLSNCMARINGVSMVVKFQANSALSLSSVVLIFVPNLADTESSFRTLDDVQMALHDAGLGQCRLVLGIVYFQYFLSSFHLID